MIDGSRCEEILLKRKVCSETRQTVLREDERMNDIKKIFVLEAKGRGRR